MITEEQLIDLFARTRALRASGRAKWDVDDVCRWSYFFVDSSREKLSAAANEVDALGYEVVGFLEPSDDDDDSQSIFLRFDRIEKHTVKSLLARNAELYSLATELGLDAYDGMDCGAIDGP